MGYKKLPFPFPPRVPPPRPVPASPPRPMHPLVVFLKWVAEEGPKKGVGLINGGFQLG